LLVVLAPGYVRGYRPQHELPFYFSLGWSVIILTIVLFLVRQSVFKRQIAFGGDFIVSASGKRYEADRIKSVLIDGDRIGLKVTGKAIVPVGLYFTFTRDRTAEGLEELEGWAARNRKPVERRFFVGWVVAAPRRATYRTIYIAISFAAI
jgi:hypothetical protein